MWEWDLDEDSHRLLIAWQEPGLSLSPDFGLSSSTEFDARAPFFSRVNRREPTTLTSE
jgi:hypothetical protein